MRNPVYTEMTLLGKRNALHFEHTTTGGTTITRCQPKDDRPCLLAPTYRKCWDSHLASAGYAKLNNIFRFDMTLHSRSILESCSKYHWSYVEAEPICISAVASKVRSSWANNFCWITVIKLMMKFYAQPWADTHCDFVMRLRQALNCETCTQNGASPWAKVFCDHCNLLFLLKLHSRGRTYYSNF